MHELFIYYRIRVAGDAAAQAAVLEFQARLRARHVGLATRLLRRPEVQNSEQTWMEIYSFDRSVNASGITPALEAEIQTEALSLADFIAGTRHVEVFVPCVS